MSDADVCRRCVELTAPFLDHLRDWPDGGDPARLEDELDRVAEALFPLESRLRDLHAKADGGNLQRYLHGVADALGTCDAARVRRAIEPALRKHDELVARAGG